MQKQTTGLIIPPMKTSLLFKSPSQKSVSSPKNIMGPSSPVVIRKHD